MVRQLSFQLLDKSDKLESQHKELTQANDKLQEERNTLAEQLQAETELCQEAEEARNRYHSFIGHGYSQRKWREFYVWITAGSFNSFLANALTRKHFQGFQFFQGLHNGNIGQKQVN